jgi:ADP-ribosylglycohydrolase
VELRDRLAGAVWGHLVGDAVGVPYEFQKPEPGRTLEFRGGGPHGQPPGTWSDDGALMLATLDSLLEVGELDAADLAKRFLAWADEGAYTPDSDGRFDIGATTMRALDSLRHGVSPDAAGGTLEHDNGNGSLMRIVPIALVGRELEAADLVDRAQRASRITHANPVAQGTCALYVLAARSLLVGELDPPTALEEAIAELRGQYEWLEDADRYRDALKRVLAWPERGGHGFVVDSFWSAWDAYAGADSYRSAIERAVAYGHDTDTTACICGGLAGITWGIGGIPGEWLSGMRGRDIVEPLVERLIAEGGGA